MSAPLRLAGIRRRRSGAASCWWGLVVVVGAWEPAAASDVDFTRDVRPILSENCFQCHGPDDAARQANLRLDTREGLLERAGDEPVVAPGDPGRSLLYRRIVAADPEERMPPPDSKLVLSPAEVETIRKWIEGGAEWREHWSLRPIARPEIPRVSRPDWAANPIDAFVLARLERAGLAPSPEAEPFRLLRRVTLDLTGLPPTPAETTAFLADQAPDAYERLVDRLLASPAFGERMAWDWLDAARYADSNGYQGDRERTMWPWRDWVVEAFNRNLPYDEFTIDQLAGDLRPGATFDQRLATGFCRNHMINGEGGRIPEENRVDYVMDMTETMGTVWLGLTLNCCRCHDHKFDPLSRRDYYGLFAFFNQTPVNGGGGDPQTPPILTVYSAEQQSRLERITAELREIEVRLRSRAEELAQVQTEWEVGRRAELEQTAWTMLHPSQAAAERQTLQVLPDGSVLAGGPLADQDAYTVAAPVPAGRLAAIRLEALRHESLTQNSLSRADSGNFVLTNFRVTLQTPAPPDSAETAVTPLLFRAAQATFEQGAHTAATAIDEDPQTGWAVWEGRIVDREHAAVFILREPVDVPPGSVLTFSLRHDSPHVRHNLGRFRLSVTAAAEPQVTVGESALLAALRTPLAERSPEQRQLIRGDHQSTDAVSSGLVAEQKRLQEEREAIEKAAPKVMVMADQPERRPTFLLERGLYNQPGEEVEAAVPASLPPLPSEAPRNRLGLAQWLVSPDHPLTARVTVNRIWQQFFGIGLVKTPEDFGVQGEIPPHGELLDWLADDFRSHGWDVKRLVRQIVTSRTYRQSSRVTPEHLERDPENRLLARGPRFRMPAWMLRDQALAAAGLLSPVRGGPPVNTYQPPGVWEEATFGNKKYVQDHGEALYRRSLYIFWRRIIGPTMFFDNAARQVCTVKVVRTNTPLHALLTLNDVTYVEAARALAEWVLLADADSDARRVDQVYLRVLARPPLDAERSVLLAGLERSRREFERDPQAASALLAVGESPRREELPAAEHAAWTALCLTVLNLDETLTRE